MAKRKKQSWTGKELPGPGPGTTGTRSNDRSNIVSPGAHPNKKQGVSGQQQVVLGPAQGPTTVTKRLSMVGGPRAKMTAYQLPPGPRGDTPSGTGNRGNRTGEMRSAYWQTPEGKKEITRRRAAIRRRNVAPWRREAQRYA